MKKIALYILLSLILILPVQADSTVEKTTEENVLSEIVVDEEAKKESILEKFIIQEIQPDENTTEEKSVKRIFIYHIPDEEETEPNTEEIEQVISSDDVTADTSIQEPVEMYDEEYEQYGISDLYTDVLHGYAQYIEDEENIVLLEDTIEDFQEIKLRRPAKVKSGKYSLANKDLKMQYTSKFSNMEYSIAPVSGSKTKTFGNFSAGTNYYQGIDTAELEQTTSIFSRYDTKYFALSTSYARTLNSTNSNFNDNFYIIPEIKINQYFSLKEILSTDLTRNRKKAEFVISLNPFGLKDTDRLRLELGASTTFDETNAVLKNQFKFLTKIQL